MPAGVISTPLSARDCGCSGLMNSGVRAAIAAIGEDAWTPRRYHRAAWDDQLRCWFFDAEVAKIQYTAFASKKKEQQVIARLIVRRVRDQNKKAR